MHPRIVFLLRGILVAALATASSVEAATPVRPSHGRLPLVSSGDPDGPACAWPFIVDVNNVNIAYPDPFATYWAMPVALGPNESLDLHGIYPSARFMAVTLYTDVGDTVAQLSDYEIEPDPGSENPYAVANPSPESGRRWRMSVVNDGAPASSANVLELDPDQHSGWLVYRIYLGNGDVQGDEPLPTIVRKRGDARVRTLSPCTEFLPGTVVEDILAAALPDPILVTEAPRFVRNESDSGLFANEANAYLSAYSDAPPGTILVVRGKLPTAPDTELGAPVVGPYDMRYFSITSNLNQKPYPAVDGAYDALLPRTAEGIYTVVIARRDDIPNNSAEELVAVLLWGDGPSQAVIIRNMLPNASFHHAAQDVTPTEYGEPSDAALVMGDYYPRIVECTKARFEAEGADGCFEP